MLQANYNLDTKDWRDGADQAKLNYKAGIDGSDPHSVGLITLAHDIHATTVHELTQFMIDKARTAGYELVTVGECMGDPPSNWYRDAYTGKPIGKTAAQKDIQQAQAKSSGTSRTATPGQPSSGSSTHTTYGKARPGGEAKPVEGEDGYADYGYDSDFSEGGSTVPIRVPFGLYAIVAIFVGVVAML